MFEISIFVLIFKNFFRSPNCVPFLKGLSVFQKIVRNFKTVQSFKIFSCLKILFVISASILIFKFYSGYQNASLFSMVIHFFEKNRIFKILKIVRTGARPAQLLLFFLYFFFLSSFGQITVQFFYWKEFKEIFLFTK